MLGHRKVWPKEFLVQINFLVQKFLAPKNLGTKKNQLKKIRVQKHFGSNKEILVQKIFGSKKFLSLKIVGPKDKFGSKKLWVKQIFCQKVLGRKKF